MNASRIAVSLLVASIPIGVRAGILLGTYPYGYYLSEELNVDLPTTTEGGGGNYLFTNPNSNAEIFAPAASLLPVSYANSVTAFDPVSNGIYTVSSSAGVPVLNGDGPFLHAWALTSGASADPNVTNDGTAVANVTWVDNTITVVSSKLPPGTPVTLQVTNVLDGSMQLAGDITTTGSINQESQLVNQDDEVGCFANGVSNYFHNSFQINTRQLYDVCTSVGSSLTLLVGVSIDLNGAQDWSASGNMSDTAGVYIDSLTPGATITSASGFNYASPTTGVPEPSTSWLFGLGLIGISAWRLRFLSVQRCMNS
jgi:PEP-CTERM motif